MSSGGGPVSLVTGSSTGIGRATALALARRGHEVWATMRDPSRGEALRGIAADEGLPIHFDVLEVTDDASVRGAVARAIETSGRLDHLVANAGFHAGNSVEDTPIELFRELIETNYLGMVRCVRAVLPHFREQRSGIVVGVTSQSGRVVLPTLGAYSGSKFAAEAMLEATALEMAPFGVRVAIVEPGLTFTAAGEKRTAWPNDTPYRDIYRRTGAVFARDAREGSRPELAADAIAELLAGGDPPLRTVVGSDALRNVKGRAAFPDDDYVALHACRDGDGAFDEGWRARFGAGPDAVDAD